MEISVQEGNLNAGQHYNLRILLRRLRENALQRLLLVRWRNCRCQGAAFRLQCLFLFTLTWAQIKILYEVFKVNSLPPYPRRLDPYIFDQTWTVLSYLLWQDEVLFVAMFTAVFVLCLLLARKVKTTALPGRREEI